MLFVVDSKSALDYGFASFVNNAEARAEGVEFVLTRERGHDVRSDGSPAARSSRAFRVTT